MSHHRLLLTASDGVRARLSSDDFLWLSQKGMSSMRSTLGPRLQELGPVPALNIDFVRLAALVFFCDRTVERPRGWLRELDLDVAVSDPNHWRNYAEPLAALLNALTGDSWQLTFSRRREAPERQRADAHAAERVVLFSGGADSVSGLVLATTGAGVPLLASHYDWPAVLGQQHKVLKTFRDVTGTNPDGISWRLAREANQVGSGEGFDDEPSRRSRSVVFLALGLALTSFNHGELWIAENGFTSLNPPMAGERRGALSTRTTHPAIIDGMAAVLADIGLHVDLRNPLEQYTKGEVFSMVKSQLGADKASDLLSSTNSCGKPHRTKGFAPDAHCGVCLGCLVRRAAFIASDVHDATIYKEVALRGTALRAKWFSAKRRETYEALRYRLVPRYDIDDILDLGLPDRADLDDALALANRGLDELAAVHIA